MAVDGDLAASLARQLQLKSTIGGEQASTLARSQLHCPGVWIDDQEATNLLLAVDCPLGDPVAILCRFRNDFCDEYGRSLQIPLWLISAVRP
jgi:hypothetical protein